MPAHLFNKLHPEWKEALHIHENLIRVIEEKLDLSATTPPIHQIMRALSTPVSQTRVVIFGQDPYPTRGHAHGLAFSVDPSVAPLPASLRNIFEELKNDCGVIRKNGDLCQWSDQGVMLINRVLTTHVGQSMAHKHLGWQQVTLDVAKVLGQQKTVAILWGNSAQELHSFFLPEWTISSAHPSPLSAYKGFFGSKPFSRCNEILEKNSYSQIFW